MKSIITACLLGIALLAPAAPATAEEVPPAPTMTVEQAAARYMTYVCPANAAKNKMFRAMDRYDARDEYGDRPHKKTRLAAKKVATKTKAAAQAFVDPAFPWPVEIAEDVQSIAVHDYEQAALAKRISRKGYRWGDLGEVSDVDTEVATVRLFLGLPPAGEGC